MKDRNAKISIKNSQMDWKNHAVLLAFILLLICLYLAIQYFKISPTGNIVAKPVCYDGDGTNARDLVKTTMSISYYTKGVAMMCGENCYDFKTDTCVGNTLLEFYCSNSEINAVAYTCENGCDDGVCVS